MQRVCGAEWWAGACQQVHRRASLCSVCALLSGGLVLVGRYTEGLASAACVVLSGGLVLVGRYIEGLACAACVWC